MLKFFQIFVHRVIPTKVIQLPQKKTGVKLQGKRNRLQINQQEAQLSRSKRNRKNSDLKQKVEKRRKSRTINRHSEKKHC